MDGCSALLFFGCDETFSRITASNLSLQMLVTWIKVFRVVDYRERAELGRHRMVVVGHK